MILMKLIKILLFMTAFTVMIFSVMTIGNSIGLKNLLQEWHQDPIVSCEGDTYEENLLCLFESSQLKYPLICLAQMYHETNHLKSDIFLENNNGFGFKCSISRTYCKGENRGHAVYKDLSDSILDYRDWQDQVIPVWEDHFERKMTSDSAYLHLLENVVFTSGSTPSRYAEDLQYIKKIRRMARSLITKSLVRREFLEQRGYQFDWCL
jgi:hypothetical protein